MVNAKPLFFVSFLFVILIAFYGIPKFISAFAGNQGVGIDVKCTASSPPSVWDTCTQQQVTDPNKGTTSTVNVNLWKLVQWYPWLMSPSIFIGMWLSVVPMVAIACTCMWSICFCVGGLVTGAQAWKAYWGIIGGYIFPFFTYSPGVAAQGNWMMGIGFKILLLGVVVVGLLMGAINFTDLHSLLPLLQNIGTVGVSVLIESRWQTRVTEAVEAAKVESAIHLHPTQLPPQPSLAARRIIAVISSVLLFVILVVPLNTSAFAAFILVVSGNAWSQANVWLALMFSEPILSILFGLTNILLSPTVPSREISLPRPKRDVTKKQKQPATAPAKTTVAHQQQSQPRPQQKKQESTLPLNVGLANWPQTVRSYW